MILSAQPEPDIAPDTALSEFDRRNSPEGLMLRYARGRLASTPARLIVVLMGGLALTLFVSPYVGIGALLATLLAEAADLYLLYRLPVLMERGVAFGTLRWMTMASALLLGAAQSAGIAAAWLMLPPGTGDLVGIAFLMSAAVNSGITLYFLPWGNRARLALYGITLLGLTGFDVVARMKQDPLVYFDLVGCALMAVLAAQLVRHVNASYRKAMRKSRHLLCHQQQLAEVNRELTQKQHKLRQLSLVAEHARDSVFLTDAARNIVWVNNAYTQITGYQPEEVLGRRPSDFINSPGTDRETVAAIEAAVAAGQPFRTQILNRAKDGREFWIDLQLVPVLDDDGRVDTVISIERDVTEARKVAEDLARAKFEAEQSARAKSEFLATMSHEIRTPMNAIIGMADLLVAQELTKEQHLFSETIRNSAEALLQIINDVLDLSRLDAGQMAVTPAPFSLRRCLVDAFTLLKPQADKKGLTFDLEIETALPARAIGDDGRIRQVLLNLVGNALKFTERGGVTIMARHDVQPDGSLEVSVEVRDTGIGIQPDRLESVFEKFTQAETDTARRFGGTGLGLTISRLLARRMGGDIRVSATPGEGAVFTFTFLLGAERAETATEDDPVQGDRAVPDRLNVLVAEDNSVNRLLLQKYLEDQPLTLRFAHDGAEAVALSAKMSPDVIFMDMSMPGMDGLEATRRIRARTDSRQPAIIALTANAYASDRQACLTAGMDDFLTKPVRRGDLLQKLSVLPRRPQAPRA